MSRAPGTAGPPEAASRPPRVVLVSRRFGGEVSATTARLQAYVRALTARGFEVRVVTRFPFASVRLAGAVRSAPGRWLAAETVAGCQVRRLRFPAEGRLERWLERGLAAFTRRTGTARVHGMEALDFLFGCCALPWVLAWRPEVVIVEQGPVWLALPLVLAARAGSAMVLQISDVKSAAMERGLYGPVPAPSIALNARLEARAWRRAARLVTVTESQRAIIAARAGVARDAVALIPNGVELDLVRPASPERRARCKADLGLAGRFVVLYAGTFSRAHDLATLLCAADLVRRDPGGRDVTFLLVGEGPEKAALRAHLAALDGVDVRVLPGVPLAELAPYLAAADVGVSLEQRGLADTVRAKLFLYMGAALPIVATDDGGEVRALVTRAAAGLLVEPERPDALAAALLALRGDPDAAAYGRAGHRYAEAHHDRKQLAARFADTVAEAAAARMRRGAPRPVAGAATPSPER